MCVDQMSKGSSVDLFSTEYINIISLVRICSEHANMVDTVDQCWMSPSESQRFSISTTGKRTETVAGHARWRSDESERGIALGNCARLGTIGFASNVNVLRSEPLRACVSGSSGATCATRSTVPAFKACGSQPPDGNITFRHAPCCSIASAEDRMFFQHASGPYSPIMSFDAPRSLSSLNSSDATLHSRSLSHRIRAPPASLKIDDHSPSRPSLLGISLADLREGMRCVPARVCSCDPQSCKLRRRCSAANT